MEKNKTKCDEFREILTKRRDIAEFFLLEKRRIANEKRRDRRHLTREPLLPGEFTGTYLANQKSDTVIENCVFQKLDNDLVYRALKQLKPKDRELLFLRYFLDWPLWQIAEYYGISISAVSQRIHKNLKNLRKILKKSAFCDL